MSRFYSRILLRVSVIKSFFAMGLDFDYNHSWTTIFGQSVAIVEGKKITPEFHYLATKYEPIFSIQVGSVKQVVITSPKIVKEVQKKIQD